MKTTFTLIALLAIFTLTSCKKEIDKEVITESVAEEISAPVVEELPLFKPFKVMAVTHVVKDFDTWKKSFDEHKSMRTANGITLRAMGRDINNPNKITVFLNIEDLQKAKDFSASPDLKEAMQKGGVTGKPETFFADVLRFEESPAGYKDRVRITHRVKDFDTWLKAYDSEGKEIRQEFGMLDRSVSRNMDDPNLVYVIFTVTDMAKAKLRLKDPALQKLMTDAGVINEPLIDFYTSVE